MTMDEVNRIENQKLLDKLAAEQVKSLAEAKRAELAKMVEPIEFKKPEGPDADDTAKVKKGKKAE